MTAASEKVLLMAHLKQDPHRTGEVSTSERDLQQVRNIKSVVTEKMMNPFQQSNDAELVNISTGQVAQSLELIEAKEKGLKALAKAETEDSVKVEPVRLKTFVEKVKKKSTLQQTKQLYIEESSVVRNLCFAESLGHKEKVDAFSHEWAEYPSSLFTPDELHPSGFSMRKGNKSDYATMLKATIGSQWKELEQLPNVESGTGYFIDLMAFVQCYQELGSTTFEELSAKYLEKILRLRPKDCQIVHVVGDHYDVIPQKCLKIEERMRRSKTAKTTKTFIPHDNLQLPSWKGFVSNHENKEHLQQYLSTTWMTNHQGIPVGCTLILGGMTRGPAMMLTNHGTSELDCLGCDEHEEADTRIFAHIAYSAKEQGCKRVVIQATDTDILMMGIYHVSRVQGLEELWMQKQNVFIQCHVISRFLTSNYTNTTSSSLLSAYAITGCDTVSYIFHCGKKTCIESGIGLWKDP